MAHSRCPTTFTHSPAQRIRNQGLIAIKCYGASLLQPSCKTIDVTLHRKLEKSIDMKKNYKIEVDCANCANLVEGEVKKVEGVVNATISFMTQRMKVEYAEGADEEAVLVQIVKVAKKVEPDFEVLS